MSNFKPATRNAVKLKLGLMGPSGSGKTYSALRLAHGLCPNGQIAFIDTENGSASLYADRFAFEVQNLHAPFTVAKFLAAIDDAIKSGFDCLIIDSISAEWQDLLAEKEMLDSRGGNSFTNWGSITKKHEDFKKAFVQAPIHIIACMRSKQEYVLQTNDKGKQAPVKVGMGAVQREGFEYECSVVFDIAMDHFAKTSKDRTSIFGEEIFQLTEETGKTLREWLGKGGVPAPEPETETKPATLPAQSPAAKPTQTRPTAARPQVATRPTQASGPATPPSRSASPTQTHSTAQTTTSGTPQASSATELPPEWVTAMVELSEVSMGMPEKTRAALIADFEAEGVAALPALLEEIAKMKGVLDPQTPGAVIAQMERPANAPVSQEAADFVDGMADGPDASDGAIKDYQYEALNHFIKAYALNRDALRSYMAKAGHLLPGAHGPTLARMKAPEFTNLRTKLTNQAMSPDGKETVSQRTVRIINKTPITTYAPVQSAS